MAPQAASTINTDYVIDTNLTIYFADCNLPIDKVTAAYPGLVWVSNFWGPNSTVLVTNESNGQVCLVSDAVAKSQDHDYPGDNNPYPLNPGNGPWFFGANNECPTNVTPTGVTPGRWWILPNKIPPRSKAPITAFFMTRTRRSRKRDLHASLLQETKTSSNSVPNSPAGIGQLLTWLKNRRSDEVHACMEATGGWSEEVAIALAQAGHIVSLVNPSRIKTFCTDRNATYKNGSG